MSALSPELAEALAAYAACKSEADATPVGTLGEDELSERWVDTWNSLLAAPCRSRTDVLAKIDAIVASVEAKEMFVSEDDVATVLRNLAEGLAREETPPSPLDLSALSITDLAQLHDAYRVIYSVAEGLIAEPRFGGNKVALPAAGEVLDYEIEHLAEVLESIRNEAHRRQPATEEDRRRKFQLLVTDYTDGSCRLDVAVKGIAAIAAEIGGVGEFSAPRASGREP